MINQPRLDVRLVEAVAVVGHQHIGILHHLMEDAADMIVVRRVLFEALGVVEQRDRVDCRLAEFFPTGANYVSFL